RAETDVTAFSTEFSKCVTVRGNLWREDLDTTEHREHVSEQLVCLHCVTGKEPASGTQHKDIAKVMWTM
ncbi:hypothetical protein KUCAC02_009379, partial [Chaenocephalus aceratus]